MPRHVPLSFIYIYNTNFPLSHTLAMSTHIHGPRASTPVPGTTQEKWRASCDQDVSGILPQLEGVPEAQGCLGQYDPLPRPHALLMPRVHTRCIVPKYPLLYTSKAVLEPTCAHQCNVCANHVVAWWRGGVAQAQVHMIGVAKGFGFKNGMFPHFITLFEVARDVQGKLHMVMEIAEWDLYRLLQDREASVFGTCLGKGWYGGAGGSCWNVPLPPAPGP